MSAAPTIAGLLARATRVLADIGIPQPRLEARLLLGAASGLPPEKMIADPQHALGARAAACLDALVARRAGREPLAQILGRREFWSLPIKVTRDTLVPRPESETLIEAALALVPDRAAPLRLLDLGTGSGCLLLALLSELPNAGGVGVDVSEAACRVARENATVLGLASRAGFLVGSWGEACGARFDLVLSNPPYIPAGDIAALEPEVARFEPRLALAGGPDGLLCYRALAAVLPMLLAPGGHALLELGEGQGDAVARLMAGAGLAEEARRLDLAGIERCLIMSLAPPGKSLGDEGNRS